MLNLPGNVHSPGHSVRADLVNTIREVSSETGVDFDYLLQKAALESSFNPQAQAAGSSARGLYQFIDSTWLETVDRHGAAHGLDKAAAAISRNSDGHAVVADAATRREILALRDDPRIAALMAAELARDNEASLEQALGREVGNTELYMAHFLGAGGAARFLASLDQNPRSEAAEVNPAAARANQAVFYENGNALTVDQVFARFAGKFASSSLPSSPHPGAASMVAEAAIPAAARPDPAASTYPIRAWQPPVLPAHLPLDTLPMFALTILEALSIPGEDESGSRHAWVV